MPLQLLMFAKIIMTKMLDAMFEAASPDVVAEDFGSEVVVLNLSNGKYFSLQGSAAPLWRDITCGFAPKALMDRLADAPEETRAAVDMFIQGLIAEGLIRPAADTAQPPVQAPESADLIARGDAPPRMEMFDDMAELILSDPIHDVEEDRGWPAIRNSD